MLRLAPAIAKPSFFPVFGNHLTLQIVFSVSECVATHVRCSMDQTFTLPSNALGILIRKCQEESPGHMHTRSTNIPQCHSSPARRPMHRDRSDLLLDHQRRHHTKRSTSSLQQPRVPYLLAKILRLGQA